MSLQEAYHMLYSAALIALAFLIGMVLLSAAVKKTVTDRILCVNMLGTMVIASIAVLSRQLEEAYLLDVGLIYTMISFIAVLMLALTYIPPKPERREFEEEEKTAEQKGGPDLHHDQLCRGADAGPDLHSSEAGAARV